MALRRFIWLPLTTLVVTVAVVGLVWLATAGEPPQTSSESVPTSTSEPVADMETVARQQLDELEVKGKAGSGGYSREAFGDAWTNNKGLASIDTACDTRNAVLAQRADYLALDDDGCTVTWGVIYDPYSNTTVDFNRGDGTIEIDHVVSLSNAWNTGAFQWDEQKRREFAHDPDNLIPTLTELNRQKGAGDAATWLPPHKAYRCEFASTQIGVKHKYGLWVAPAEHEALLRQLDTC
ncbi:HNH endonuclease family protein [Corynebacterium pilosum]|uniref:Putative secreted protein n=1 Tax=Corynebacterium pilosum TaxID=35756 RepID=A0A376CQT9_9CORY|nr:HNH endonuclease family protein [Corynebacterium pilosum]STC70018.1 putative secreted protein [Corynebacterium pilosum]